MCPADCRTVTEILSRVGDKWSVQVVVQLGEGPKRFNELRRSVTGISQRMLTLTLRSLERDGLVTRTVYPTIPPRVDYQLTGLGCSLLKTVGASATGRSRTGTRFWRPGGASMGTAMPKARLRGRDPMQLES